MRARLAAAGGPLLASGMRYPLPLILLGSCFCFAPGLAAQGIERVSVDSAGNEANGSSVNLDISADGRFVVFSSGATNLVPGKTNPALDIYLHDRLLGTTERVSLGDGGVEADKNCDWPSVSDDGRYVAFESLATNLVPNDTNNSKDIFLKDRLLNTLTRINVGPGGQEDNGSAWNKRPMLSGDGEWVVFHSDGDTLVANDTNGSYDVFFFEVSTQSLTRLLGWSGNELDFGASTPRISDDGSMLTVGSQSSNMMAGGHWNSYLPLYVVNLERNSRFQIQDLTGFAISLRESAFSSDGSFLAFSSGLPLIPLDTNGAADIYVLHHSSGLLERVSISTQGQEADSASGACTISSDGRFVLFESRATNLVPGDTNGTYDVFLHDRNTGTTTRTSVDWLGNEGSGRSGIYGSHHYQGSAISADGRFAAFESTNPFVPGDSNNLTDVFVRDFTGSGGLDTIHLTGPSYSPTGQSISFDWSGAPANSDAWLAYSLSLTGSIVAGHSFDLGAPTTVLYSGTNSASGTGSYTSGPVPSGAAGRWVHFEAVARDGGGAFSDSNPLSIRFY